jgi:hypothetical protein
VYSIIRVVYSIEETSSSRTTTTSKASVYIRELLYTGISVFTISECAYPTCLV